MKNFKVTDMQRFSIEGEITFDKVVILADTEEDVPDKNYSEDEPNKKWAPFSVCYIAATGNCKVLNTQGVWVDA